MREELLDLNLKGFHIDPKMEKGALITEFSKYDEFNHKIEGIPKEYILRYIILMYDKNNKEIKNLYPDVELRKRECAYLAGFDRQRNGKFDSNVTNLLIGKDDKFNAMILRYCRFFNDPDYLMYISYWGMLLTEIKRSLSYDEDIKSAELRGIRQNIYELKKEIKELELIILNEDDFITLSKALYANMENESQRLRPEHVAEDVNDQMSDLDEYNPFR